VATFREMQDSVLAACGLGSSDRTRVKAAINEAYFQANSDLRLYHVSADVAIEDDQGDYSIRDDFLITDLVLIRSVALTNDTIDAARVRAADPAFIERLRETSNVGTGQTYFWALAGVDTFMVWPSVAGTATIRYVQRPDPLASDDSEPWIVPPEHHDVLVLGACLRVARRESQQLAQGFRVEHQAALRRLAKWRSDRQGHGPKRFRVRGRERFVSREDHYWPGDQAT
jgi:hypothetical protein